MQVEDDAMLIRFGVTFHRDDKNSVMSMLFNANIHLFAQFTHINNMSKIQFVSLFQIPSIECIRIYVMTLKLMANIKLKDIYTCLSINVTILFIGGC